MNSTEHQMLLSMKFFSPEIIRFIVSGSINTFLTYLIYLFFLSLMPYGLSFSITYIIGIYISYYLNCRIVFNEKPRWRTALKYPIVYLVQYIIGIFLLYFLVHFGVSEFLAPLVVIVFTLPATFFLSRWIIKKKSK